MALIGAYRVGLVVVWKVVTAEVFRGNAREVLMLANAESPTPAARPLTVKEALPPLVQNP